MEDAGTASLYQWIAGWVVLGIFLGLINKNKFGHLVFYYALCLMILFVTLTQYQFIAATIGHAFDRVS